MRFQTPSSIVSEEVSAHRKAAQAQALLSDAFESMPAGVLLFDREERLVQHNTWFLQRHALASSGMFTSGTKAEDIFRKMAAAVPTNETQLAQDEWVMRRLAYFRQPVGVLEIVGFDGRRWQITESHTSDGGRLSLHTDVTDQRTLEESIRRSEKMSAVGQLTGGVAHDFNNILMVIMANVEALEDEENLHPSLREMTKGIGEATQRAAELTRQLLAFSRKQPLRPQVLDVNDMVAGTGKLLRRTLGEQVEIDSILTDDLWEIEVDSAQLESALVNLSINARDAMPGGGRLLIETKNSSLDADYVAYNPDVAEGDYVMLAVTDTGSGMPPDVIAKVFEPFFTTKEVGKGTGLGLSMVYGFIKQSNGHIKIYSEVGVGTTIKIYLPRFRRTEIQEVVQQAPPMSGGTGQVLVVEDDAPVRASVVRQLASLGYEVAEAVDGASGLAAFESATRPYDLLLTDVIMPGPLNGRALADEVARRWPKTPVVFMSGYTEDAIIHHGRLDAGVLLLSKPFRKRDLALIVKSAIDNAELSQEVGDGWICQAAAPPAPAAVTI